jgi:glycosyltransferase involved in cell wall biosynthesis
VEDRRPAPDATGDRFPGYSEASDRQRLCDRPIVSIIVASYNHEQVLGECIHSLAAQKAGFPFEILIAEDCSTDRTREAALALQRQYPELVRVIWTPQNKGATLNTIFATSLCRGEFIGSCDGDDFWIDEGKLARQVAAMRAHPEVDLCFTTGYRLFPDGSRVHHWSYGPEERIIKARELFATLGWMAPTASLLFRAEVLRRLPPWFAEAPFGDFTIVLAGSVRGGAYYDPRPTICYRTAHPTSFTVQLDSASRKDRIKFFENGIRVLRLACRYYRFPVRRMRHRIDDYRLSLAKLQAREGRHLTAMSNLVRIHPRVFVRGVLRRLGRPIGPHQA